MEENTVADPTTDTQATEQQVDGPAKDTQEDPVAKLEARLKEKDAMIGRHGNAIGAFKKELESLRAQLNESRTPPGPSEESALADLYAKMDSGEIDIASGMQQALHLNSNLTAKQVMARLQEEQKRAKTQEVHQDFLKKNPDYEDVLNSGVLDKYLEEDPLADEYVAFKMYKADQLLAEKEKEAQAKIAAAKEEGAKLAKGAAAAGRVLGKQGATAAAPARPQGPWKNSQEAQDALMARLKSMRSAS